MEKLNYTLFLLINGREGIPTWLVHIAKVIANDLIYLVPLLLVSMWLWFTQFRSLALKALFVTLLGITINLVIGDIWPFPRPFMIGLGHTWISHVADASFPSDHMTVFVCIGLTLLLDGAKKLGIPTLITGIAVAWARIFLGVHFPLDMIGSVLVAYISYLVVTPLWSKVNLSVTCFVEKIYGLFLPL